MIDSPESPCPPLTNFFSVLAQHYPKIFFKPIFTCAASTKDLTIANQICVLNAVARFLPDFWVRDADMISIAIMSSPEGTKQKEAAVALAWGQMRFGQSVLLLELAEHLHCVRQSKDLAVVSRSFLLSATWLTGAYRLLAR